MDTNSVWGSWGLVVASIVTLLVVRAVWVLQITGRALPAQSGVKRRPLRTLIVLGSGGHTAEMMSLVRVMDLKRYAPRHYIAGATDNMSLPRAERVEAELLKSAQFSDQNDRIPRLQMNGFKGVSTLRFTEAVKWVSRM